MSEIFLNFIQQNSPDGGFLQSDEWAKFQESTGRKAYNITSPQPSPYKGEGEISFYCNVIEHALPIVGKYLYAPRGPIFNLQFSISNKFTIFNDQISNLIQLAKSNNAGWVRIEPATSEILSKIKGITDINLIKAPHDMQPRQILMVDTSKTKEQLLSEMKPKTRYNIKVAQKHGVVVNSEQGAENKNIEEFLRLTRIMAKRQGISSHPNDYYKEMCQNCSSVKLYTAKYNNKVIAANLVAFHGDTCTYLHGASDDDFRNVMATYLLQWQQMLDAKTNGCKRYDFGGVKTVNNEQEVVINKSGNWGGITKFKLGFSPNTKPVEFPGSYDIIINPVKYWIYRIIQRGKKLI